MKTKDLSVIATTGLLALTIGCATPAIASAAVAAPAVASASATGQAAPALKSTIVNRVSQISGVTVASASTPLAVDKQGNIYYDGANNDDIMRVTPANVKSTLPVSLTSGSFVAVRGIVTNNTSGAVYAIIDLQMGAGQYQDWVFQLNAQGTFVPMQPFASFVSAQKTPWPALAVDPVTNAIAFVSGNVVISFVPTVSSTQATTTVIAGNANAGFSGDGGKATAARINQPQGIAFDAKGNLYIADTGNNRVRQVSPDGIISTIGGNGTAGYNGDGVTGTAASLSAPTEVATDAAGNVYIADSGNNRIRVLDNYRTIATVVGSGSTGTLVNGRTAPTANLNKPLWVGVAGNGNVLFNSNATTAATVPNVYVAGPLPSLTLTTSALPSDITPAGTSGYMQRRGSAPGSPASFNVTGLTLTPSADGTTYNSTGPITFTTQAAGGSQVTITAQSASYTSTNPVEFSNLLLLHNVTFTHTVGGVTYTSTIQNLSFAFQKSEGAMKYVATTPPVAHSWGDLVIPDLKNASGTVAPDNANVAGAWIMKIDLKVTPNYSAS